MPDDADELAVPKQSAEKRARSCAESASNSRLHDVRGTPSCDGCMSRRRQGFDALFDWVSMPSRGCKKECVSSHRFQLLGKLLPVSAAGAAPLGGFGFFIEAAKLLGDAAIARVRLQHFALALVE
jgi:hypothetical protein